MRSCSTPLLVVFCGLAPVTQVWNAPAAPPNELIQSAPARIEQHRKGDVQISVRGKDGRPVEGVTVHVRQVRHAFLFGGSVFPLVRAIQKGDLEPPFNEDDSFQSFRKHYVDLFNYATLPYYWWSYEREQGNPAHEICESVASWCKQRNITTKGHPLVWNYREPSWLPNDATEIEKLQLAHVRNCVARFRGTVDIWDVVNETTNFAQGPNKARAPGMTSMWETVGRIELPRRAFRTARKANPAARLVINDFHVGDDFAEVVRGVVDDNGNPLYDAIGVQSHMHGGNWSNAKLWEVCERFAPFGRPIHFTELTVLSGKKGWHRPQPWPSTPEGEAEQARAVARIYTLLFSHPSVEAITWWNLTDGHAWMQAPAGLLRKDMSPKPAYQVLKKLITKDWWTETTLKTDADGHASFRGFYGQYEVLITMPGGGHRRVGDLEVRRSLREGTTRWVIGGSQSTE